ncbi:hypothetical protein Avbf_01942 [Armadillidium vulgare]|nr:hypothetical protein Avbf_01942 [Armadillidium vulgare]
MGIAEVSNTSEERKSLLQAIEERVKPLRCSRGIVSVISPEDVTILLYRYKSHSNLKEENDLRGKIKNSIQIMKSIIVVQLDRVTRSSKLISEKLLIKWLVKMVQFLKSSDTKNFKTNNHFVQSLSLRIPVKRISVLCFEYFASFLDGEILINFCSYYQYQNFYK